MSTNVQFWIECDGCGYDEGEMGESEAEALAAAVELGWMPRTDIDLCPDCWLAAEHDDNFLPGARLHVVS